MNTEDQCSNGDNLKTSLVITIQKFATGSWDSGQIHQ